MIRLTYPRLTHARVRLCSASVLCAWSYLQNLEYYLANTHFAPSACKKFVRKQKKPHQPALTCAGPTEKRAPAHDIVLCPVCREPTRLKSLGVLDLPRNRQIANIVEKLKLSRQTNKFVFSVPVSFLSCSFCISVHLKCKLIEKYTPHQIAAMEICLQATSWLCNFSPLVDH